MLELTDNAFYCVAQNAGLSCLWRPLLVSTCRTLAVRLCGESGLCRMPTTNATMPHIDTGKHVHRHLCKLQQRRRSLGVVGSPVLPAAGRKLCAIATTVHSCLMHMQCHAQTVPSRPVPFHRPFASSLHACEHFRLAKDAGTVLQPHRNARQAHHVTMQSSTVSVPLYHLNAKLLATA